MQNSETYLRAILATVARQTFSPESLREIVTAGRSGSDKQVVAYNLCDGTHSQADISQLTGLDKGSLNRSLSRWIEAGVVVRLGDGRPLHVYPLS